MTPAELRAQMIAEGLIRPNGPSPLERAVDRRLLSEPVLLLDHVGRAEAAHAVGGRDLTNRGFAALGRGRR